MGGGGRVTVSVDERHPMAARRWPALLLPLALAALLSGLLAYALYAAPPGPLGNVVRLDLGTMQPTMPDMAVSRDGEFVAITWSDGYISTAAGQGYVYLSFGSETDGGWPRFRAYPSVASTANLAKQPAIAFDPRAGASQQVHMAWSQHTGAGQSFNQIYYATCNLATPGTCYSLTPSMVRSAAANVFMPDIAVDMNGVPHVVWVEEHATGTTIKYANGSNWGLVLNISPSSNYTVTQPSIAYANGCLHIVWASNSNAAGDTFESIGYKRQDSGGSCGGNLGPLYFNQWSLAGHSNPKNPRVAASGNNVYIVWDIDSGGTVDGYDKYYLVYNYSTDGGTTWARPPDGSQPEYLDFPSGGVASFTPHPSRDELESGRRQYASRLRPDVTLEGTMPHLMWSQVVTRSGENEYHFDVFHTTYQSSAWMAATNVTTGTKADFDIHSAAPAVVVGKDGHVHAAYLEETQIGPGSWLWDQVIYQGPIEDRTPDIFLPVILRN
jgi:hypothetical protein